MCEYQCQRIRIKKTKLDEMSQKKKIIEMQSDNFVMTSYQLGLLYMHHV